MDKQFSEELKNEASEYAGSNYTKNHQPALYDARYFAFLAGATSSSTVKELEKENRQLINMYMELKADYDMLNEKYQQLSIPSAVEEPPVESWGIKDIKLGFIIKAINGETKSYSYSLAIMFSEWLNIHCKPSNKLKDGKVAWNYYCPSSLRQLGRFTTEELYDIFEKLNSNQNVQVSDTTEAK